jgi:hypothetical protein
VPDWANHVLIVTGVGAFVAVVIFALLVLFGLVKPADPESGKWATKKVLFPLIAAVGGGAAALFASGKADPAPDTSAAIEVIAPPVSNAESPPAKADVASEVSEGDNPDETQTPPATQPPAATAISCTKPAPAALAGWAAEALGPRPDLQCPTKLSYPACVSELRARGVGETSGAEAADCGKAVGTYRRIVIAPILQIKAGYDSNLDDQESALRAPADVAEQGQRDYVLAEINRMNGQDWAEFSRRDAGSESDLDACYSSARCRSSQ